MDEQEEASQGKAGPSKTLKDADEGISSPMIVGNGPATAGKCPDEMHLTVHLKLLALFPDITVMQKFGALRVMLMRAPAALMLVGNGPALAGKAAVSVRVCAYTMY